MEIILPKTLHEGAQAPIFFLLGPIGGGGDWQSKCCLELKDKLRLPFSVAVPCRWTAEHPLYPRRVIGNESHFKRQLEWERYYLTNAARLGCIIAWLPCEDKENPRIDGQPYARDSYGEIGEWRGRLMHDRKLNFVIGAAEKFPGRDVISRNFEWALGDMFKVHETLSETITAAIFKSGAY